MDFNESIPLYKDAIKAGVLAAFHPIEGKGYGFKNTRFLTDKSDQGILLSEYFYRFSEQAVNQSVPNKALLARVSSADELKRALSAAVAGDEIIINNGVYLNWAIDIANKGQAAKDHKAAKRIIVRAETKGGVIFTNKASISEAKVTKPFFTFSGEHIIFEGFTFKQINFSNKILHIKGGSFITTHNNSFIDITRIGRPRRMIVIDGAGQANRL